MEWCFKDSVGSSSGLLSMWDPKVFDVQDSYSGDGYLGVKGVWGADSSPCFIFNIYSPCNIVGKRALWEELRVLRSNYMFLAWCIAGDFNVVRSSSERKGAGVQILSNEMVEFNEFIDDMELIYLPLIGRKYTWHRANGSSMSRLDRFLVSEEWMSNWQDLTQWGLKRSI